MLFHVCMKDRSDSVPSFDVYSLLSISPQEIHMTDCKFLRLQQTSSLSSDTAGQHTPRLLFEVETVGIFLLLLTYVRMYEVWKNGYRVWVYEWLVRFKVRYHLLSNFILHKQSCHGVSHLSGRSKANLIVCFLLTLIWGKLPEGLCYGNIT